MVFRYLSLLVTLCCSVNSTDIPPLKSHTAFTRPMPLAPGEVTNSYHKLSIPKGPIAVHRFAADIVEILPNGTVVPTPLSDAYLHHHVVGSRHESYEGMKEQKIPMKPEAFSRNIGFGAGTESRGTPQVFPYPYAFITADGEDEWIANVHIINTREMTSVEAAKCLECPCTLEDIFTPTSLNGDTFYSHCNAELLNEKNTVCSIETYHGGLRCCHDGEYCIEKKDEVSDPVISTYYLRYVIEYSDVVPEHKPLQLATCCDASGDLEVSGNIEYDVPICDPSIHPGCVHTLSTRQRVSDIHSKTLYSLGQVNHIYDHENTTSLDVNIVYIVGHQHRGGLGIMVFDDQTEELICASEPKYGQSKEKEIGNEDGYIVAISTCTIDPPRRMKSTDILRIVALYNNTQAHTGVMSLFYMAINVPALDVFHQNTTIQLDSPSSTGYFIRTFTICSIVAALLVLSVFAYLRWRQQQTGYQNLGVQKS